jgi:hypothetical protein
VQHLISATQYDDGNLMESAMGMPSRTLGDMAGGGGGGGGAKAKLASAASLLYRCRQLLDRMRAVEPLKDRAVEASIRWRIAASDMAWAQVVYFIVAGGAGTSFSPINLFHFVFFICSQGARSRAVYTLTRLRAVATAAGCCAPELVGGWLY